MSAKGGPVFTFCFPGEAVRPPATLVSYATGQYINKHRVKKFSLKIFGLKKCFKKNNHLGTHYGCF